MSNLFEFQKGQLDRCTVDIAGPLLTATYDLYQTAIDINQATPLSAFTAAIATYAGYAQGTLVWDTPSVADDGTVESVSHSLTFRPTDAVTPNNIWGCFIRTSGGDLIFAGQFDGAPLPMDSALDQIVSIVRYRPASSSIVVIVS